MNTTDVRLTLYTPYVKLADGIYTLTAERWISATSSASAPKGGHHAQDVSTPFTVQNAGIQRAVSLEMAERVLTVAEAQKGISLMIEKENVAESLNLTLEQKIADGYSTFAALGTVTTGTHTANVSNIPAGSYRFVLSSGSVSTTLDFVVVS